MNHDPKENRSGGDTLGIEHFRKAIKPLILEVKKPTYDYCSWISFCSASECDIHRSMPYKPGDDLWIYQVAIGTEGDHEYWRFLVSDD